MTVSVVPAYTELLWPTVCAVRGLGGSGSIDEINERVLKQENFSDDQQSVLHGDGPQTEIEYRLAWARTYLKGMGLLENSKRGVWTLTDAGRTVTDAEIAPLGSCSHEPGGASLPVRLLLPYRPAVSTV